MGAVSSLMVTNRRLTDDTDSLKTEIETAALRVVALKKIVSCHFCLRTEKAVFLSCGHLLCDVCVCGLKAAGECPVCKTKTTLLCRVML